MKLNRFIPFLLLFVCTFSFAQKEINVKGKVVEDGTAIPLEYATITFKTSDNTIVTGGITDEKGNFNIKTPINGMIKVVRKTTTQSQNLTLVFRTGPTIEGAMNSIMANR